MGIGEQQLLRMLEPAVRPLGIGNVGATNKTTAQTPIEERSFESILEEAQQLAEKLPDLAKIEKALAGAEQQAQQQVAETMRTVSGLLSELQHVENASVARLRETGSVGTRATNDELTGQTGGTHGGIVIENR